MKLQGGACNEQSGGWEIPLTYELEKHQKAQRKSEAKRKEDIQDFSDVYQTNAGAKAINAVSAWLYSGKGKRATLDQSDVTDEYEKRLGHNAFKGNESVKHAITVISDKLPEFVSSAAYDWYNPSDTFTETYRGTDMSISDAIDMNPGQVYRFGTFYSATSIRKVAESFLPETPRPGVVGVLMKIRGNSAGRVRPSSGMSFAAAGGRGELETLYSPFAAMRVRKKVKGKSETYKHFFQVFELEEVPAAEAKNAPVMPHLP